MKPVGVTVIFQIFLMAAFKSDNRIAFTLVLAENFTNFKTKIMRDLTSGRGRDKDACTINLMKKILANYGKGILLSLNEDNDFDTLRNLHENFAYFYFTNPEIKTKMERTSFYHLLIYNSNFTSTKVLQTIQPQADTRFLVVVKNESEVLENLKVFWKHQVMNVIVAFAHNKQYKYYTYFPYRPNQCGQVSKAVEVGECDTTRGAITVKKTFYPNKSENLHSCQLNVTLVENIPSAYYTSAKVLDGWEVNLVAEIIKRMNGVPKFKIISPLCKIYTRSHGYASMLKNADVAGGLLIPLMSLSETDFSMYDGYVCSTWAVPKIYHSPNSLRILYEVFSLQVWILLLMLIFVFAVTMKFLMKKSIWDVLFKILSFFLGNSLPLKKRYRPLAICWIWFAITLSTIYQSKFQSILILPMTAKQLDTTDAVLKSDLKIMGLKFFLTDVLPYLEYGKYNRSGRFIEMTGNLSFSDLANRLGVKRDTALLGFKEIMQYHIYHTVMFDKVHIQSDCIIKYLLGFVLKKNSHLTETFIKMTKILNENGCATYWMKKHLLEKSRAKLPQKIAKAYMLYDDEKTHNGQHFQQPFTLDKMKPVFVGYVAGISIASVTFFFEIISIWYKKKKVRFNCQRRLKQKFKKKNWFFKLIRNNNQLIKWDLNK